MAGKALRFPPWRFARSDWTHRAVGSGNRHQACGLRGHKDRNPLGKHMNFRILMLLSAPLLGPGAFAADEPVDVSAAHGSCDAFIGPEKERCLQQGGTVATSVKSGSGAPAETK